jgi:hypothetical protein
MSRVRRAPRARALATLTCAVLATAACGSANEPVAPESTGLQIVDGDGYTDTIGAIAPRLLTVEVRAGARSSKGLVVRFEAIPTSDPTRYGQPTIRVSKPGRNAFGTFSSDTTDDAGRVRAEARLGIITGEARLVVTCPELALADTASFTVLPGRPWRIEIPVRDTAVRVGASYLLQAYAVDGNLNRRSDPVTYESAQLASVATDGRVQAGQKIGRGAITVRVGGLVDTAKITVLPVQKVALVYQRLGQGSWIATALTDGSRFKNLVQATPTSLSLSATGDRVLYDQETGTRPDIFVVDESGTTRMLSDSRTRASAYPRFDASGKVYFSGMSLSPWFAAYRMADDGSDLTELFTMRRIEAIAVSPDGARLAMEEVGSLVSYEIATGSMTWIAPFASLPTFSPDGKRIAYLAPAGASTGIAVSSVDGSATIIHAGPYPILVAPAWLSDSEWLITADSEKALLVNATTGQMLRMPGLPPFSSIATSP